MKHTTIIFQNIAERKIVILEIGISHGGSLQMWKNYFGDKAKIYRIAIALRCKEFEEENSEIFIDSKSDRDFLAEIRSKIPKAVILTDNGGLTMIE